LCRSCDRGQAYCPEPCRAVARRGVVRAARQRHRDSPEGRADHRDHQRAYRARRGRRVRDLGSRKLPGSATVCAGGDASGTEVGPPVIAACKDNNDEFDHGHARPGGDARSSAGHGAGGRDDEGGAGGSIPDAPPGGTHPARRTGALASRAADDETTTGAMTPGFLADPGSSQDEWSSARTTARASPRRRVRRSHRPSVPRRSSRAWRRARARCTR